MDEEQSFNIMKHILSSKKAPEHLDWAVNHHDDIIRSKAAESKLLQPHHIDKLANDENPIVQGKIALHPSLSDDHLDKFTKQDHWSVTDPVSANRNLKQEHISNLLNDFHKKTSGMGVLQNLSIHPNLTSDHIDKIISYGNIRANERLSRRPDLNDSHIHSLVHSGEPDIVETIATHPKLKHDHIDHLIKNEPHVRPWVARRKDLNSDHIDKLIKTGGKETLNSLVIHNEHNLSSSQKHAIVATGKVGANSFKKSMVESFKTYQQFMVEAFSGAVKGFYASAKPDQRSLEKIFTLFQNSELKNHYQMEPHEEIHATTMYSKENKPYMAVPSQNKSHCAAIVGCDIFGKNKDAIVLKLLSPDLHNCHERWKEFGCEHGFPEFNPHVTLVNNGDPIPDEHKALVAELHNHLQVNPIMIHFQQEEMDDLK